MAQKHWLWFGWIELKIAFVFEAHIWHSPFHRVISGPSKTEARCHQCKYSAIFIRAKDDILSSQLVNIMFRCHVITLINVQRLSLFRYAENFRWVRMNKYAYERYFGSMAVLTFATLLHATRLRKVSTLIPPHNRHFDVNVSASFCLPNEQPLELEQQKHIVSTRNQEHT